VIESATIRLSHIIESGACGVSKVDINVCLDSFLQRPAMLVTAHRRRVISVLSVPFVTRFIGQLSVSSPQLVWLSLRARALLCVMPGLVTVEA